MIYTYQFNQVPLCTGDVICTVDGLSDSLYGKFWLQVGRILPGKVDHCTIYLGPAGRCVEAGPGGVIVYEMPGQEWNAAALADQRQFVDQLYGVAYPLAGRGLSLDAEHQIREGVAHYCLEQARLAKPYNLKFPDPDTEDSFYCSQLVYKAYLQYGINLNTNMGMPAGKLLDAIVFPEEIWNGCVHRKVER
jgi:hypothetical protein